MRVKKSTLLKQAKQRIEDGESTYICLALLQLRTASNRTQVDQLTDWIEDLLEGNYTYTRWITSLHHEFLVKRFGKRKANNIYPHDCKEGRLQWLDWMINYWKGEGE